MSDTATASATIKTWFETGDVPTQQQFADFITSYANLVDNNQLDNIETAITAHAGGGQGSAYQLTKRFSSIDTVATALDSVKLPAGGTSKYAIVRNSAANAVNIYPTTGAYISKFGVNNPLALPQYCIAMFTCTDGTNWQVTTSQEFASASNPVLFLGIVSPVAMAVNQNNNFVMDALNAAMTFNAPTGLVGDGQRITLALRDNGTSRALTWNAAFQSTFALLPTATVVSKWQYFIFQWSTTDSKWLLLSYSVQGLYTKPCGFYRAVLDQTGTSAPVATILENTLGFVPTWGRDAAGQYHVSDTGKYPDGKIFTHFEIDQSSNGIIAVVDAVNNLPDEIDFHTYNTSFAGQDVNRMYVEIFIYP